MVTSCNIRKTILRVSCHGCILLSIVLIVLFSCIVRNRHEVASDTFPVCTERSIIAHTFDILTTTGQVIMPCDQICVYSNFHANCRNSALDYVPRSCNSATTIDIRNNVLEILTSKSFIGFQELLEADLEFNLISNITGGTFSDCAQLERIYLQFNFLTEIMGGAFEGAGELLHLFLNQNSIRDLHKQTFSGLGKLTRLYMGHNEINELPAGIFGGMHHLQYLHIGDNHLGSIPPGIFNDLFRLKYLNLKNNNLKVMNSKHFEYLILLEELNLSGNLITFVDPYQLFPKVNYLDLYDNNISEMTAVPGEHIHTLYLAENPIRCTCAVVALKRWLANSNQVEEEDIQRADVTCSYPEQFKQVALRDIADEDLCTAAEAPPDQSIGGLQQPDQINGRLESPDHMNGGLEQPGQINGRLQQTAHLIDGGQPAYINGNTITIVDIFQIALIAIVSGISLVMLTVVVVMAIWRHKMATRTYSIGLDKRPASHVYEEVCRPASPTDSAFGSNFSINLEEPIAEVPESGYVGHDFRNYPAVNRHFISTLNPSENSAFHNVSTTFP